MYAACKQREPLGQAMAHCESQRKASPEGEAPSDELIEHHPQTPQAAKHKPMNTLSPRSGLVAARYAARNQQQPYQVVAGQHELTGAHSASR